MAWNLNQMSNIFELLCSKFQIYSFLKHGKKKIKVKNYDPVDKFDLDIHYFSHNCWSC